MRRVGNIQWTLTVMAAIPIFLCGCAGTIEKMTAYTEQMTKWGQPELPEPIADSIKQMPPKAATVTAGVRNWIKTGRGSSRVRFSNSAHANPSQFDWLKKEGFTNSSAALFRHGNNPENSQQQVADGRLDYEDPYGRIASFRFVAGYRPQGSRMIVENLSIEPIYSYAPEPIMMVVPLEKLPQGTLSLPNAYGALFDYIGNRAVSAPKTADHVLEQKQYAFFIFSRERVSPASMLEIKISNDPSSNYGYKKNSRYIDFNGWRVGMMAGSYSLSDDTSKQLLYVKSVFTPGKEVGFIRPPVMVGLFCLNGTGTVSP